MSLMIDTNEITGVLLADGWHAVKPGSFDLDSYEFGYFKPTVDKPGYYREGGFECLHGGGTSGVCSTGFVFEIGDPIPFRFGDDTADQPGQHIAGPLTAILAVRTTQKTP